MERYEGRGGGRCERRGEGRGGRCEKRCEGNEGGINISGCAVRGQKYRWRCETIG